MNDQLSEKIQESRRGFSKSQRAIARYLQDHPEEVAFMTASRLGATVGVSESTVVRFATEIGYSGYPAMQQAVQEMIRNKMTSFQRLEMTSRNIPQEKLLDAVLGQDIDILRRTREGMNSEEFYRAVEHLVELAGGTVVARAAILAEGDAAKREDIIYLGTIPLFVKE